MTDVVRPETAAPMPPDAVADARLERIWEAIARPDVTVLTTDVFDTVLWRLAPDPPVAFLLTGARLQREGQLSPELSPAGFGALRHEAEARARELLDQREQRIEVSLAEIYELLGDTPYAGGATHKHAMQAELEVERDLLMPDLDILALLVGAKALGKTVAAVSDTYFTEAQLRWLLDQPELAELELDHVFASNAYRLGKSGGLFEIVLRELGVAPEQVVHIGDNLEADVSYPTKLGIACTPFPQRPGPLQEVMNAERRHVAKGAVFHRGPSRTGVAPDLTAIRGKVAARAERERLPGALRPYWDAGALVYGPVLTGFAEWVQQQAVELGVSKVHAFMREGVFLGGLIERAGEYQATGIKASPLWLNREVLSVAGIGEATGVELAPMLVRRRSPTVGRFLKSLGLTAGALPRFGAHLDTSLDDSTVRSNLLHAIESEPAVRERVLEHAAAARERVVRYVLRELGDDPRLVCIDLGWGATAQGLIGSALRQAGVEVEVAGLYLATHRGAARRLFEGQHVTGYLAEFGWPAHDLGLLVRSPEVLEQICMPDHGSQIGLTEDLEPVLADVPGAGPVQAAQAETVRDGVRAFQREWARYRLAIPSRLPDLAGAPELLRPMLTRAVVAPTTAEVAAFGAWHHDENQGSDAVEEIVDDTLAASLRHMAPQALKDLPMSDLYWPFGIAARVDETWAELIDLAAAGELPWEALAGSADTGPFEIEISGGVNIGQQAKVGGIPLRNRFGLSAVSGTLSAGAIQGLTVRPCDKPAIVRIDYIELRCHVQGRAEPEVLRYETPQDFAGLTRINAFVLNPNILIAHSFGAELRIDLTERIVGHVFRIDVRVGFATMAIGELVPTPGRIRSPEEAGVRVDALEATLADMESSLSWRVTKPLRTFKRLFGR